MVIILFVQNDPFDCSQYLAKQDPRYATFVLGDEGELVLRPAAHWQPTWYRRLAARSALVRYLKVQRKLFAGRRSAGEPGQIHLREGMTPGARLDRIAQGMPLEQRHLKTWELIEAILARAQEECARHGAMLGLAYRGSRPEVEAAVTGVPYVPPPKETDPWCLKDRLNEMGEEFLKPITTRLGMPYLDLTEALIAKEKESGKRHHWVDDGHYNEIGHAAAGEAMAAWVERIWQGQERLPGSEGAGQGSR